MSYFDTHQIHTNEYYDEEPPITVDEMTDTSHVERKTIGEYAANNAIVKLGTYKDGEYEHTKEPCVLAVPSNRVIVYHDGTQHKLSSWLIQEPHRTVTDIINANPSRPEYEVIKWHPNISVNSISVGRADASTPEQVTLNLIYNSEDGRTLGPRKIGYTMDGTTAVFSQLGDDGIESELDIVLTMVADRHVEQLPFVQAVRGFTDIVSEFSTELEGMPMKYLTADE